MANRDDRDTSADNSGEMNQRLGRELHERDQQHQGRYSGYRGQPSTRKWDEGNYFHTGPSPRGAQDQRPQDRGYRPGSTHYTGEGSHPGQHYGNRSDSPYRSESSYLNHGNRSQQVPPYQGSYTGSSKPGNYNEPPAYPDKIHREGPGTRSRYKEDDYRYGSGSHNWYQEGRFTPNHTYHDPEDHRSYFQRIGDTIRDTWNDIMHSDDPEYLRSHPHSGNRYNREEDMRNRERYGADQYRNRNFDRGYERGPHWADDSDTSRR